MSNLWKPSLVYLIVGVISFILLLFLWLWRRKRDPLPERDPKCVWHSEIAKLDRIYDGDTFFAHVKGHKPIDGKPIGIRIRGIDTPEMKDSNPTVRKKAERAKALVVDALTHARTIHLYNISMNDKYGRMLATVFCDHTDLAKLLLKKRLAKSYDGGTKKVWK